MDPETGCGLQSTGQKARLLIGAAGLICFIGQILTGAVSLLKHSIVGGHVSSISPC